jgi:hypothetical protein
MSKSTDHGLMGTLTVEYRDPSTGEIHLVDAAAGGHYKLRMDEFTRRQIGEMSPVDDVNETRGFSRTKSFNVGDIVAALENVVEYDAGHSMGASDHSFATTVMDLPLEDPGTHIHACIGDPGVVVCVEPDGTPTVHFLRSGKSTALAPTALDAIANSALTEEDMEYLEKAIDKYHLTLLTGLTIEDYRGED